MKRIIPEWPLPRSTRVRPWRRTRCLFPVLRDPGQKVGRAFGLVYDFSDGLKTAYQEFGTRKNGLYRS